MREEIDGAGGDFCKRSRTKNSLVLAASAACHFQPNHSAVTPVEGLAFGQTPSPLLTLQLNFL